jgi:hypothetical protein
LLVAVAVDNLTKAVAGVLVDIELQHFQSVLVRLLQSLLVLVVRV